jgi:hypothetical protein
VQVANKKKLVPLFVLGAAVFVLLIAAQTDGFFALLAVVFLIASREGSKRGWWGERCEDLEVRQNQTRTQMFVFAMGVVAGLVVLTAFVLLGV